MAVSDDIACVILAGGRGKRMGSAERHKVCFPILGVPAIVRAMRAYKQAGLRRFLVVVGQMAGQVVRTVAEAHPDAAFVYQAEPRGTGHAARVAVEALARQGGCRAAVVIPGDKLIQPHVVADLLARYDAERPELLLATLAKQPDSTAGRVVQARDGRVLGIVERADIDVARDDGSRIAVAGERLTAGSVEKRSPSVNPSLYAFDFAALRDALARLETDNVQGELYLTDAVGLIAAGGGRVETLGIQDPRDLMAFNTPEELLAIEQVVRGRETPPRVTPRAGKPGPRALKPAWRWLTKIRSGGRAWRRRLDAIYGPDAAVHAERRRALSDAVAAFIQRFGPERKALLCRAPGRVNLMGRHVDHRGGFVNVMAFGREVILVAAAREDDVVTMTHLSSGEFPDRQFRIGELLRGASWSAWEDFVDSRAVREVLETSRGDWSHYARAALLRLQHECRDVPLRGMDCVVAGNIPMGAGLSSSSALVVAFGEAAVALNGLDVRLSDFIDLCGEGEWFVGSRGGSADHAAIRAAKIGHVSRIGFFPFRLDGEMPLPDGLRIVLAHSGTRAVKSREARDVFNHRVACYDLAELLLSRRWPAAAGMEHLRDLLPDRLGVRPGDVYRALKLLPPRLTRKGVRELFDPADQEAVERILATHGGKAPYDLRGVTLYGLGEIARSDRFADVLRAGDLDRLAAMLHTSHDGDRLVRRGRDGSKRRFVTRTDDATLEKLADADADLADQPGRYRCSTEAIDRLVDLADGVEGVIGSQLAGAGLGGCMMIVARAHAVEPLLTRLHEAFYRPRDLAFGALACTPVAGAGLLEG